MQRKAFKQDTRNKGKPYTSGLFGWARHINYGGYLLWRVGFATAGWGWVGAAVAGAWFSFYFSQKAVPFLDHYCQGKVSLNLNLCLLRVLV